MTAKRKPQSVIPVERIASAIYLIRGQKVMLDRDLADLYGVETRTLIQAVKRNIERFPDDFMFQLTKEELENWRSQIVISNPDAKMGLRRQPYAFTESGVAMLSSVLRSKRAVQVNIMIMRTSFVSKLCSDPEIRSLHSSYCTLISSPLAWRLYEQINGASCGRINGTYYRGRRFQIDTAKPSSSELGPRP
jgi:hypothetical protein